MPQIAIGGHAPASAARAGVAVITITSTPVPFWPRMIRWRTPKRCCSSTTRKAKIGKTEHPWTAAHVFVDQRNPAAAKPTGNLAAFAASTGGAAPLVKQQRARPRQAGASRLLHRLVVLACQHLGRRANSAAARRFQPFAASPSAPPALARPDIALQSRNIRVLLP